VKRVATGSVSRLAARGKQKRGCMREVTALGRHEIAAEAVKAVADARGSHLGSYPSRWSCAEEHDEELLGCDGRSKGFDQRRAQVEPAHLASALRDPCQGRRFLDFAKKWTPPQRMQGPAIAAVMVVEPRALSRPLQLLMARQLLPEAAVVVVVVVEEEEEGREQVLGSHAAVVVVEEEEEEARPQQRGGERERRLERTGTREKGGRSRRGDS
jgi:hypothetical protein